MFELQCLLVNNQSAAYDLLDHNILLKKLALYNFDEYSLQWFKSYLSGRSQSVQVEAQQSPAEDLGDHAAPQGSVLGGILFLINENDFPACREEGESVLFVDDDTDVVNDSDPELLMQKIQHEADLSCSWLQDNRMVVAGEKSKLLIIGTKELRKSKLGDNLRSILVDGKTVEESPSEKLLGVIVNNHMTWKEHLHGEEWRTEEGNNRGLIPQLAQRLGILRKLSRHTSKKKLKMLISGLFYSKLSYCLPLYCNTWGLDNYVEGMQRFTSFNKEDNRRIQVLQNAVCRLLLDRRERDRTHYFKQNISTRELLEVTGDLSIHQLGAHSTLMMLKRILQSGKPEYLASKLVTHNSQDTRSGSTLLPARASLNLSKSSFIYRAIKLYNQLPEHIRQVDKITSFKKETKEWVKSNIQIKP